MQPTRFHSANAAPGLLYFDTISFIESQTWLLMCYGLDATCNLCGVAPDAPILICNLYACSLLAMVVARSSGRNMAQPSGNQISTSPVPRISDLSRAVLKRLLRTFQPGKWLTDESITKACDGFTDPQGGALPEAISILPPSVTALLANGSPADSLECPEGEGRSLVFIISGCRRLVRLMEWEESAVPVRRSRCRRSKGSGGPQCVQHIQCPQGEDGSTQGARLQQGQIRRAC